MIAHRISMDVDSATWQTWRRHLRNSRRRFRLPVLARGAIPGVATVPRALVVAGDRFLLEVGKACLRPDQLDDPGRLFGLLKYAGALSRTSGHMNLSREMQHFDTHKKKVLSDEFGCGVAFLFAQHVLRARRIIDIETAIKQGWIATRAGKRERPDYIAELPGGGLLVLEAKGTQSGHSYSWDQVGRGCDQVRSVKLPRGSARTIQARVAVGVSIALDSWGFNTSVHVEDPPEKDAVDYAFRKDPAEMLARGHYLRVASLVGDGEVASRLEGRDRGGTDLAAVARRVIRGESYVGSEVVLRSGGRECGLFVGLSEEARSELVQGDWDKLAAREEDVEGEVFAIDGDSDQTTEEALLHAQHTPLRAPASEPSTALLDVHDDVDDETAVQAPDGTAWVTWCARG